MVEVSSDAEGALSKLYLEVLDVTDDLSFPERSVWKDVGEDVRMEVSRELPEVAEAAERYLVQVEIREDRDMAVSSYFEDLEELPEQMVDLDGEKMVFQAGNTYHDVDELGESVGRLIARSNSPMRLRFKLLSSPEVEDQGFQEFFEYWDNNHDGWAEEVHSLFHETCLASELRGRYRDEAEILSRAETFKELMEDEWSNKGYKARQFAEIYGNTVVRKFLE